MIAWIATAAVTMACGLALIATLHGIRVRRFRRRLRLSRAEIQRLVRKAGADD